MFLHCILNSHARFVQLFHWIWLGSHFVDIDECTNGTDTCSPFAVCNNTMGDFNCSCLEGFEGDGFNCTGKYFGISAKFNTAFDSVRLLAVDTTLMQLNRIQF